MANPWLENQLRLADRAGALSKGSRINPVQSFGLEILMMLDRQEGAERWWKDFRSRIGAANPAVMADLFPEIFKAKADAEEIDEQAKDEQGNRDLDRVDQTKITWSVPASDQEREELDRFLSDALGRAHTITVTDLEGGEWT